MPRRGQATRLPYARLEALKEKSPDDPAVEALFARARTALTGSKGDFIELTP